jgi:DNA polymerase-1
MSKEARKKLVLLDSHAIIHRAYHALPDFSSSKGEPTGALYGLSTMLLRIVADIKPDYIIACYDLPQKTFRHEAYDAYKAGRAKADESLIAQIISSRNVFEAFGVSIYDAVGFEADDVLGTIVEETRKEKNLDVIIASGDMDTLQLVEGTRVSVFTLRKGINDTVLYDEESVLERFGFKPALLPDYKGLRGDPSDNIIGIKGIGEKTAQILISNIGTIENIYKKLKTEKGIIEIKNLGITERIVGLLKEGEEEALFSKTLATIRRDAPIAFVLPEKTFRQSIDISRIETLFRELEFRSLSDRLRKVFAEETKNQIETGALSLFESAKPEDEGRLHELSLGLWLLNSEAGMPKPEDVIHYKNAASLVEAGKLIEADIEKAELSYVYKHIELPLIPIIKKMEQYGIAVDVLFLKKLGTEYHKNLSVIEKEIYRLANREFNINSPKQLGEILFDELKLGETKGVRLKKTAGGARSTRESELEKLKDAHPIINSILQFREIQKLLSTYIDTIPPLVSTDGRLHAKFHQGGTTTGRFSSSDPNLQNIPIKNDLGRRIRRGFIAAPGHTLLSFDYSQIELRIAALLSQDTYLLKVFEEGRDVHAAVASRVFGVKEEDVTREMRRRAKVINFGILYGMGVTALQQNLGTDRKEAQAFYDNYFAEFPSIRGYLDSVLAFAEANGYTETLFGRRRYFPGLRSKIPFIKAAAERTAINAPIQGTAADVLKIAMQYAEKELEVQKLSDKAHLLLQVHDELIYEVENSVVEKVEKIVEEAMGAAIPKEFLKGKKPVPLAVGKGNADNWEDLK